MWDQAGNGGSLFFSDSRRRLSKRPWDSEWKLWNNERIWDIHARGVKAEDKYEIWIRSIGGHWRDHDADGVWVELMEGGICES